MSRSLILFSAQALLIVGLSFSSGFPWPSFSDASWDTALFLTPIGIIKNFTADDSALRSFYSDPSAGQTQFSSWQWAAFVILDCGIVATGFAFMRSKMSPRR